MLWTKNKTTLIYFELWIVKLAPTECEELYLLTTVILWVNPLLMGKLSLCYWKTVVVGSALLLKNRNQRLSLGKLFWTAFSFWLVGNWLVNQDFPFHICILFIRNYIYHEQEKNSIGMIFDIILLNLCKDENVGKILRD